MIAWLKRRFNAWRCGRGDHAFIAIYHYNKGTEWWDFRCVHCGMIRE